MEARLAKGCVLIHCQVCKCVVNVASKWLDSGFE